MKSMFNSKRRIFYVGFYDELNKKTNVRDIPLAGRNKMEYIIDVLQNYSDHLFIISPCSAKKGFCAAETKAISDRITLILFYSYGSKSFFIRILNRIIISLQLFLFLLFNIKNDDFVVSYHSLATMKIIELLHHIIHPTIIYEFEEFYSDVINKKNYKKKELNIARKMDAYIFPTKLLNNTININNKPFILCHGTYRSEPQKKLTNPRDGIIHCVYAGNLEERKGACEAILSALYLPSNYHIHIIGFGSVEQISRIQNLIIKTTQETSCLITYDGLKSGEEYINFLQSCNIGLCTQDPNAEFTSTSFPSKILSYLANGLRVVCINIPAIYQTKLQPYLSFYSKNDPKDIADAILNTDVTSNYNSRELINNLSSEFKNDIYTLLTHFTDNNSKLANN